MYKGCILTEVRNTFVMLSCIRTYSETSHETSRLVGDEKYQTHWLAINTSYRKASTPLPMGPESEPWCLVVRGSTDKRSMKRVCFVVRAVANVFILQAGAPGASRPSPGRARRGRWGQRGEECRQRKRAWAHPPGSGWSSQASSQTQTGSLRVRTQNNRQKTRSQHTRRT